jgi:hypothetical protein
MAKFLMDKVNKFYSIPPPKGKSLSKAKIVSSFYLFKHSYILDYSIQNYLNHNRLQRLHSVVSKQKTLKKEFNKLINIKSTETINNLGPLYIEGPNGCRPKLSKFFPIGFLIIVKMGPRALYWDPTQICPGRTDPLIAPIGGNVN